MRRKKRKREKRREREKREGRWVGKEEYLVFIPYNTLIAYYRDIMLFKKLINIVNSLFRKATDKG
jgi:hypothetical protein